MYRNHVPRQIWASMPKKSQINVIVLIRLKFKLYAVSIKWGSCINLSFKREQGIVYNWDFSFKISRHCHKSLVPKIVVGHDQRERFVKRSLRDRLGCLVDSLGMILLAVLFLLPSPNCFFRVCFPTLFAAVLKDFLTLIISAFSGAANSNMSAPTRFAAGTTYLRKKGITVLPNTCARAPNPLPVCIPTAL